MKTSLSGLGFTLIEYMLALLMGSFLLIGIMKMYVTIVRNYYVTEEHSRLQENMRITHNILQSEINSAGNFVCGETEKVSNMLNQSEHDWWSIALSQGMFGIDGQQSIKTQHVKAHNHSNWPQDIQEIDAIGSQARLDSDVLLLASVDAISSVAELSQDRDSIKLRHAQGQVDIKKGSLWMICDVENTAFFQIGSSYYSQQLSAHELSDQHHYEGSDGSPQQTITIGQADDDLLPGNSQPVLAHSFINGSQIGQVSAIIFFVAQSVSKQSYSLFREYLIISNGKLNSRREELVEGVENLQFEYAIKDTNDEFDNYYSADQISAINAWHQIVSIRVGVLFASADNVMTKLGPESLMMANQEINIDKDKRRRVLQYFLISIKSR